MPKNPRLSKFTLFIVGLFLTLSINYFGGGSLKAQVNNIGSSLTDQGQQIDYSSTITDWKEKLQLANSSEAASIHLYLAISYRDIGKFGLAIKHFNEAHQFYHHQENAEKLAIVLIEQARTHNQMGQPDRAISLISQTLNTLEVKKLAHLKAAAYQARGTAYSLKGQWDEAIDNYLSSRNVASVLQQNEQLLSSLNDLYLAYTRRRAQYLLLAQDAKTEGIEIEKNRLTFLAGQDYSAAIATTTRAVKISQGTQNPSRVTALLNLYEIYSDKTYLNQAQEIVGLLPPSLPKADLLLKVANVTEDKGLKQALLQQALQIASSIGDKRTESFALGELGNLSLQIGNNLSALSYSQQAQLAAQSVMAVDSLYRWQWQAGKIYNSLGEIEPAKIADRGAIASLQKLRFEIAQASPEFQLDVQIEVEPIYREFLSLLLENDPLQKDLKEVLEVAKQLQFTELQSFFGDACLEIKQKSSTVTVPPQTARIHSLILKEASYILLELENQPIKFFKIEIEEARINDLINSWRKELEATAIPLKYQELSQYLYTLLIQPLEEDLTHAQIKTLIFINDGLLRNVPLSALYDGNQFLIEKYAIVNSLGFNFTSDKPNSSKKSLIFGLSVSVDGFSALPFVERETKQIQQLVGGKLFLNDSFTETTFRTQINQDYTVIHLATHAQFGGTARNTFIQTFSTPIFLAQLEEILSSRREPIELLVLSACKTATGNKRSLLGLAGIALRSGTRNVLASLWAVGDRTTSLLTPIFYQYWSNGISKEEALQKAQKELISKGIHPKFWSAFILVGN
ncbi:TPR repeat-containing protein (plasmid) [Gloeothece citriformis PCC 7424]|uniref:TPR repeat-containing protein n=1 Tax=Gloeothece citriformis (strain PCC 7424) TaxID=65393 RepID=B7KM43_GLOC7|nr:CHAT domain-containing protein [Gloeothece citriformis]ACK73865.1 TPR repeat-containing protein [Gloeothece citriformis PCC 7424]